MSDLKKNNSWLVRYEVTFYGNNPERGSFREIKEDRIIIFKKVTLESSKYFYYIIFVF